jgi:hypothetical protein
MDICKRSFSNSENTIQTFDHSYSIVEDKQNNSPAKENNSDNTFEQSTDNTKSETQSVMLCSRCRISISYNSIISSIQHSDESCPNIEIKEIKQDKTYSQTFYFDVHSLDKFKQTTHSIVINLDPENHSCLKFLFDIQNIQSNIIESSKQFGYIGVQENIQYLNINILSLRIEKEQQPQLVLDIKKAFQKFSKYLSFKGGFVISFNELNFDLTSKSLYLKPNIGKEHLIKLQEILQEHLCLYLIEQYLSIRLTIFKHTNLSNENVIKLLYLHENAASVGFTSDSISLKNVNQINNNSFSNCNVSFKMKFVSPD